MQYWKRSTLCSTLQIISLSSKRLQLSTAAFSFYIYIFNKPLMMPLVLQDVPLISLANIFQNARLWEDALTVARMAVEIAPHFVVNHFTLANVYIAMVSSCTLTVIDTKAAFLPDLPHTCTALFLQEEFEKAMHWYESTLKLQPEFGPAKDRLRTIQCYLLTKRDRRAP